MLSSNESIERARFETILLGYVDALERLQQAKRDVAEAGDAEAILVEARR